MRAGKEVRYRDGEGGQHTATVLDLVGAGPSGYKTLDLTVGADVVRAVPHQRDAPRGPAWALLDETLDMPPPPEPEAPRRVWRGRQAKEE